MKQRLTIVISHPIQYHSPLYAYAQKSGYFDVHVIYHNDRGSRPYFEKLANSTISYDNNLLDGYSFEFLTTGDPSTARERLRHILMPHMEERILASKPDAVYFHGYNSIAHIRSVNRLKKISMPLFLRGENEDMLPRPMWRNLLREGLLARLIGTFDAILYIGKANREFFQRRGVPECKLFFVPYSADSKYFGIELSPPERKAIRQTICAEYGIDEDSVIFINTCKHRPEKRPMDLVRAYIQAAAALGSKAGSSLLLVGDGPQNQELRQAVADSGVGSVYFTGYVNQSRMRDLLLAADYCVNPAAEPWGCVFNEALPAGLALISSDLVVGWRDMVSIGENGFVYRCGSVEALHSILESCIRHPEWRAGFSEKSKLIAQEYSYESCVVGIKAALQAVSA